MGLIKSKVLVLIFFFLFKKAEFVKVFLFLRFIFLFIKSFKYPLDLYLDLLFVILFNPLWLFGSVFTTKYPLLLFCSIFPIEKLFSFIWLNFLSSLWLSILFFGFFFIWDLFFSIIMFLSFLILEVLFPYQVCLRGVLCV